MAPGLPEDAIRSPSAIGYTALAEQVAAQASATARLQEQLAAVLEDGRRREAEARRREAQLSENAARVQAENSAALKALSDSMIALGAAQQQSVTQFSDLRSSLDAEKRETMTRDSQRDDVLSSLVKHMAELDMRSRHPPASSAAPPSDISGIYSDGGHRNRNGDRGRARHGP